MKVGDIEVIKYRWCWHSCKLCGLPAAFRITYLYENARRNPASSAYGRDDCSWCTDEESYACKKHEREVLRAHPAGMSFCSSFRLSKFKHMGFYKEKIDDTD